MQLASFLDKVFKKDGFILTDAHSKDYIIGNPGNNPIRLKILDILYTYLIGKNKLVKELNLKSGDFKFCIELPIKAKRNNLKCISFPCYERSRIGGRKKVNKCLMYYQINEVLRILKIIQEHNVDLSKMKIHYGGQKSNETKGELYNV